MGFFDGFPFTNTHQLNLDWILQRIGKVDADSKAAVEAADKAVEAADKAGESAAKAVEAAETFDTDKTLSVAGKAADAAATGEALVALGAPHNYLDNSDFRNPVNQRNFESLSNDSSGVTYVADRWIWWNVSGGKHNVTLTKGAGLTIGSKSATTRLFQKLDPDTFDSTKTYTAYCKCGDGTLVKGDVDNTTWGGDTYSALFDVPAGTTVIWAVVYEGEYTAETLPEYKPKGYGVELMECQRYYLRFVNTDIGSGYTSLNGGNAYVLVNTPSTMRIAPTAVLDGTIKARFNGTEASLTDATVYMLSSNGVVLMLTDSSFTAKHPLFAFVESSTGNALLELEADL